MKINNLIKRTIKPGLYVFMFACIILMPCRAGYAQEVNKKFDSGSAWNPTMSDMEDLSAKCGLLKDEDLYQCLISEMQSANASNSAVEFTKLLGGRAYMKLFRPLGIVDIAYVYYPFEKIDREGYCIVNGSPALVDPDNYDLLSLDSLENTPRYIQLLKAYPHLALFAGDRMGPDLPLEQNLADNGERIIVNYALRDGCYHCELLAYADFGFDFDSAGNFKGTSFLNIRPAEVLDSTTFENKNPANVFSDPSRTIALSQGEEFEISLQSNHSAGLKWVLADSLDESVVTLLGSNFLIMDETLPNAAGKEIWSFKTTGPGTTEIKLKYVRDWQDETAELQNVTFTLEVN
jgi:predicted secreted protein